MKWNQALHTHVAPVNDANRLGLHYRHEATRFGYVRPIWDIHTHINGVEAADVFLQAADHYGVERIWSMTAKLEDVDAMRARYGDRFEFIAVPDYSRRHDPETFRSHWLTRITEYAERGARLCKFYAAPRGRDISPDLRLDSPLRIRGMEIARDHGMNFMTHVADPDTWFATRYADHHHYGRKADHYVPLRRLLDRFDDVFWIAAHMGGSPENIERLDQLLCEHPNLYLDTSATKWMIRELSRNLDALIDLVRRHPGRILFGSDIVATSENCHPPRDSRSHGGYDLYASRYWALRTLLETDYRGPSPIVDPDLSMVDPDRPRESTAELRGAHFDAPTLRMLYHDAAANLLGREVADLAAAE